MPIKKVLWPTDFSRNSEYALPYVQSLTEKYQPEIHVLYVIEDLAHHESWYGEFNESRVNKLMQWENEKAGERLEQLCEKHMAGCPLYIKHTRVGDPAREILDLANNENMDMIVMASKGSKGHFEYGSIAEKVSRNTTIPVMMIPVPGKD